MWIGQKIRSMKSVYPPLFSRESPLFIEIQLFEQKEFLRKENKTELFQYIRLFIMVLHQYQYLLWYCNFAVHTPSSSYTFSVTAVLITAMNIKQTFKELQNCTARQSWSFSHLLNLHGCDEFAINFLHSWVFRWICLIAGDVASSESFDRNNFGGTWLVGKGHCLPAESKCGKWTAKWQQRCEQLYRTKHWKVHFDIQWWFCTLHWTGVSTGRDDCTVRSRQRVEPNFLSGLRLTRGRS